MDNSEFVNQYIETTTKTLHDLLGKTLILETRAILAEKALATLQNQHQDLTTSHEELTSKYEEAQKATTELANTIQQRDGLAADVRRLQDEANQLRAMKQECDDLRSRYDNVVSESEQLRVDFDSIRNDLRVAREQVADLDKQNEELLMSNQELRNMYESYTPAVVEETTPPTTRRKQNNK